MIVWHRSGKFLRCFESLVPFRGRRPFRQFMQNKPKYGIKVFCLVDSRMFYTSQMEIYAEKNPEGPYNLSNSPADLFNLFHIQAETLHLIIGSQV